MFGSYPSSFMIILLFPCLIYISYDEELFSRDFVNACNSLYEPARRSISSANCM